MDAIAYLFYISRILELLDLCQEDSLTPLPVGSGLCVAMTCRTSAYEGGLTFRPARHMHAGGNAWLL